MPAIKIKKTHENVLDNNLRHVLQTESSQWAHYFFSTDTMRNVLDSLNNQIRDKNFFTEDYGMNTFLDFLKAYIKLKLTSSATSDSAILKKINIILEQFKTRIFYQRVFNKPHINMMVHFLDVLQLLFHSKHRYLFKKTIPTLSFNATDLKRIAITVVKKKNDTVDEFIIRYLDILKLSFDVTSFLNDYQQANEGITSIAKIIFLDQETSIPLLVTKFFSALAYEFTLLDYYQLELKNKNISMCQTDVLDATIDIQSYFLDQSDQRDDVSLPLLKYYFFKYFIKNIKLSPLLKNNYSHRLSTYSNENFNPLPYRDECPSFSNHRFIIKHSGLEKAKLEIVCQAKACADRNHNEWLKKIKKSQRLPTSDYTLHIFSDARSFSRDIYRYVDFGPFSTGFFTGIFRNKTQAIGNAYVQYRSDPTSWWQVLAHEYAHHLNFRAFGHIPRNFDEGLSYRLILDPCFNESFQDWLNKNYRFMSLALLSNQSFIGYNPSSLLMTYFVDTHHPGFAKLLNLYPNEAAMIQSQLTQLIQEDTGFLQWLDTYRTRCAHHPFKALGQGDNYCPSLIAPSSTQNGFIEKTSIAPQMTTVRNHSTGNFIQKKPSPETMAYDLILAIYNRDLLKFRALLPKADVNYRDRYNGNTPLHYLYFYANCDTRYLNAILKYNPVMINNHAGLLPDALAERNCNSTQLQRIRTLFARYTPSNKTALIPYPEQPIAITVSIPLSALISGGISAGYKEIIERYQDDYPSLPYLIFYGLKPASLALGSAAMNVFVAGPVESMGLEETGLSFIYYLSMNYFGLIIAQLGEKTAKKMKSQLGSFLITILCYTFFLNPGLLTALFSEGLSSQNFAGLVMPLLSMLSSGIVFKTGEWGVQKGIKHCFPHSERGYEIRHQDPFSLSTLLADYSKNSSDDEVTLNQLKKDLEQLTNKIKKRINHHVYQLNFEGDLESAIQNILALLERSQTRGSTNQNAYRNIFKALEEDLKKIQSNLARLSQKKSRRKKKSHPLWKEVSELLTRLREIRPLPWNYASDRNEAGEPVVQEASINSPFIPSSSNENRFTQPPALLGRMHASLFIRPKTDSSLSNDKEQQEKKCLVNEKGHRFC